MSDANISIDAHVQVVPALPPHIKYSMGEYGDATAFTSEEVAKKISNNKSSNKSNGRTELGASDFVPDYVAEMISNSQKKDNNYGHAKTPS